MLSKLNNKIKKNVYYYRLVLLFIFHLSNSLFSNSQTPNSWTRRADFPGQARTGAVCFAVKNYGYVGTGETSGGQLLRDFWKYDASADSWSQIADFGGVSRKGAVGFAVDTTGFVGSGSDGNVLLKDFWAYDVGSNSWSQTQDMGQLRTLTADARRDATAISGLTNAYVMCGYNTAPSYLKDNWEFNPTADTMWTMRANFANVSGSSIAGRRWGIGFRIDSTNYYGTGYSFSQDYKSDFWQYDPNTNFWTQLADFGGGFRSNSFAFSLYGKGYVGCGTGGTYHNDLWCYLPATNSWQPVADYPGAQISNAISMTIGNRGFAGLGNDSMLNLYNDFWEYTPDSTINIEKLNDNFQFILYPNPAHFSFRVYSSQRINKQSELRLVLYDVSGKQVLETIMTENMLEIETRTFSPGQYFYVIRNKNNRLAGGKFIIN